MHVLVTTCTARKDPSRTLLPATQRYLDLRIDHAEAEAERRRIPLFIFSGVLGLVAAEAPVPWYDHALQDAEVERAAQGVASVLRDHEISRMTAILEHADTPGWRPYHRALQDGCAAAGISFALELWVPPDR